MSKLEELVNELMVFVLGFSLSDQRTIELSTDLQKNMLLETSISTVAKEHDLLERKAIEDKAVK